MLTNEYGEQEPEGVTDGSISENKYNSDYFFTGLRPWSLVDGTINATLRGFAWAFLFGDNATEWPSQSDDKSLEDLFKAHILY